MSASDQVIEASVSKSHNPRKLNCRHYLYVVPNTYGNDMDYFQVRISIFGILITAKLECCTPVPTYSTDKPGRGPCISATCLAGVARAFS